MIETLATVAGLLLLVQAVPPAAPDAPAAGMEFQQVIATVHDAEGRLVTDLSPEDFILEENGAPQAIAQFRQDSDVPVSLGILLDTSGSMAATTRSAVSALGAAKGATRVLLDLMKDGDEFLLMSFSNRFEVRQRFTRSWEDIDEELRRLRSGGDTNLFGSVRDSFREMARATHRKRALIVVTDADAGGDLPGLVRDIHNSEIFIYTFGVRTGGFVPDDSPLHRVLDTFAAESGGRSRMFDMHSERIVEDMIAFVREIAADLRGQYTLGYYRSGEASSGGFTIRLRTVQPGYQVRMRRTW